MNTSYIPQPDFTLNIANTAVQDISPITTQPIPSHPLQPTNISYSLQSDTTLTIANTAAQDISPITTSPIPSYYSLQHTQDYLVPHPSSLKTTITFFYAPHNDFQMYHIICKEIPLTFQSVSQLIVNTDNNVRSNNIFTFYLEQPQVEKIYEMTCRMVPHTLLSQFLNKNVYNIKPVQSEYQQQEFSEKHQENLKFHLRRDLIHYLASQNAYEDNYNLYEKFTQDYRNCENTIMNSTDTDTYSKSQQYNETSLLDKSFTSQQDNNYYNDQLIFQNDKNNGYNYYHYNDQPY